jgi:hypothetical protein
MFKNKFNKTRGPTADPSADVVVSASIGGQALRFNGKPIRPSCCDAFNMCRMLLDCLDSTLQYIAAQNLGPTRCSRHDYLWFHMVASGYNWIQEYDRSVREAPRRRISGTKDNWNWDTNYPLASERDQLVWMDHMMVDLMPYLVPDFDPASILQAERDHFAWTPAEQAAAVARVRAAGNWAAFKAAWDAWWAYRQADGSDPATQSAPPASRPNAPDVIQVDTTQNITGFSEPYKWTQLKIPVPPPTNYKTQQFLTYNWFDVTSSAFTPSQSEALRDGVSPLGPGAARDAEIDAMLALTESLTDAQKVSAEFWAGGPFTGSPPGMFIWLWKEYMRYTDTTGDVFIYSGFDLAQQLFETSRIIWGIKRKWLEARPIQEIRRRYAGPTARAITKYDGTGISGELWTPYQETNFVTPPFADFSSGHSGFSRAFELVMTDWFGPTIPDTAPRTLTDLSLLSPTFGTAPQTQKFGHFTMPAGASMIQPGIVPAVDLPFSWSTWADISESAGTSRFYGGIHAQSAHDASRTVVDALHAQLRAIYNGLGCAPCLI